MARSNLLAGLKDGSLDKLVGTMPGEEEPAADSSVCKPAAAVPQQPAAQKTQRKAGTEGDREQQPATISAVDTVGVCARRIEG